MGIVFNPLGPPFDFTGSGGSSSGIGGTIALNQIAFGTAADTIGGSANLTWTPGSGGTLQVVTTEYTLSQSATSFSVLHTPTNNEIAMDTDGEMQFTSTLIELNGPTMAWYGIKFENATGIKARDVAGHTILCQAYDVDGAAYKTFGTGTSGNTPSWDWSFPSGGTLTGNFTTLQVNGVNVATTTTVTDTTTLAWLGL